MVAYQGKFDGLCGMYAIVNAYEICDYGGICEELFQVACGGLAHRRWPTVLWEGTTFGDMTRMIHACQSYIKRSYDSAIMVSYPFWRDEPRTNADFWDVFDGKFQSRSARCAIVGLTAPSHHWVVISRDTERRVWFTDSGEGGREYRKNLASLHAGERRLLNTQWRLDRRELIVFSHA